MTRAPRGSLLLLAPCFAPPAPAPGAGAATSAPALAPAPPPPHLRGAPPPPPAPPDHRDRSDALDARRAHRSNQESVMPTFLRDSIIPSFRLSVLFLAACGSSSSSSSGSVGAAPAPELSTAAPSPDPRVGLRAGWMNAGEAAWNLRVVSKTPPSKDFFNPSTPGDRRLTNSD